MDFIGSKGKTKRRSIYGVKLSEEEKKKLRAARRAVV
jgi:hypothetical protein